MIIRIRISQMLLVQHEIKSVSSLKLKLSQVELNRIFES